MFKRPVITSFGTANDGRRTDRAAWGAALLDIAGELWDLVMGSLIAALRTSRVVLIAGDLLCLLPLHAACSPDTATVTGRRYALDLALITYAPSARSLLERPSHAEAPTGILALHDPELSASEQEVTAAHRWFAEKRVMRTTESTRSDVLGALDHFPVVHFACHGEASLGEPLHSHLHATNDEDEPITLQDFLSLRLTDVRLMVLSACETGVTGAFVPDEAIALHTGIFHAGAAGVIGTLWPVGDLDAAMLTARFYQLWRGANLAPPEALRRAQIWMRDATLLEKHACLPEFPLFDPDREASLASLVVHDDLSRWAGFVYVGT